MEAVYFIGWTFFQSSDWLEAFHRSKFFWRLSQRSGDVSKALDNLKAISGVIEPFSFTILDNVFLDTPSTFAKSLIFMDNGSKWWFLMMRPGWAGALFLFLIAWTPFLIYSLVWKFLGIISVGLLMIVLVINVVGIPTFKFESNPPISGYFNRPYPSLFRF